jgi:T5SS/PEP-CTERM-associated repeat protein
MGSWRIELRWGTALSWRFFVAWACLGGVVPLQAQVDDKAPPNSCFSGARINDAGLQEIQDGVQGIYEGLKAHANDNHPSIQYWTVRRKGSTGCAYHFQYGKEGDFVLYHPDDYHISLGRDISFKTGKTTGDIQAALKGVADAWEPFLIADFANGAKIIPKKSGNPNLIYFTYDFETSPSSTARNEEARQMRDLADDVIAGLAGVTQHNQEATSYHLSFGMAEAGTTSATAIQNKVIRALKNYGGYTPLQSSQMTVSAVALLESAHIDDATRYTTYIQEPLIDRLGSSAALSGVGAVYTRPNLPMGSGTLLVAGPDWLLVGDTPQADVKTYLDWLEDDEALVVVSAARGVADQGWLTIDAGGCLGVGVATEEDTGHLVIGLKPNDVGSVTMTGGSATLIVGGDVDVGEYGSGSLTASAGAVVASYGAFLGYRPGSVGTVSLRGAGTAWYVKNDFNVGCQGTGTLMMSQGAQVFGNPDPETISYSYVGSGSGSYGAVGLTDPGTCIQLYGGSMIVGAAGMGALSISNGATVFSSSGSIGDEVGGQGAVLIDAVGSSWQLSNNLWIGAEGSGALAIQNGGSATCQYLTIGAYCGAAGVLRVGGGSSTCYVEKDVFVGGLIEGDDVLDRNNWTDGGVAQIAIDNGGRLSAGRNVWVGGEGEILLNGGTLAAENLDIMAGGQVISTGGTLSVGRQLSVDGLLQLDAPLSIANGMSLVGNGVVSAPETRLLTGSLLAPGHSIGTLSFSGDLRLDPGSQTQIELGGNGQCDKLVVSGGLRLGGTLVLRCLSGGNPSWGYNFAAAGHTSGAFDAIDTSALPVAPKRVIFGDTWSLIKFTDLRDLAGTDNARRAASVLDAAIDAGQSSWLVDRLVTVGGGDSAMTAALNQMTGELYATLPVVGVQNTTNLYRVLGERLRPDPNGPVMSRAAFSNLDADLNDGASRLHLCSLEQSCEPSCGHSAWGGWAIGYGFSGQASGDGNAHGIDYSSDGTLVAVERGVDCDSRFGVFYGYSGSNVSTQTVEQNARIDSHQGGVYLCRTRDDRYSLLAGSFGHDDYRVRRAIDFDDMAETAAGDHGGWQSAVYLEHGRILRGDRVSLQPYGALQYIHLRQEAFAESGTEGFDLNVGGADFDSLRGILGGRLAYKLRDSGITTTDLFFRSLWMHEFLRQTTGLVTTDFASGPVTPFVLSGLDLGRDWVVLGPGCTYAIRDHVSLFANYDLQFNARQTIHVGSGGIQFQW